MDYRFALTRGQIVTLILCLVFAGLLLFAGGMLTGYSLSRPEPEAAEPGEGGAAAAAETAGASTPSPGSPAGSMAQPPEKIWELQLSARLSREDAQPDLDVLAAAGYQAYVVPARDSRGQEIFTVRMGPWASAAEAAAAAQAFSEHSGVRMQPVIRQRPKPAEGPGAGATVPGPAS